MSALGRVLVHESGVWELDLARRELRARGASVPIGGRAFEILAVLAEAAGELVGKDDLMSRVWPGAIVEENTVQVHISAIRKALGGDRDMLKTASGRGYRLLGTWTPREETASAERVHSEPSPPAKRPPRTNLPAATSDLIGRAVAAHHLAGILSAYRVVTLTGPGGIGKTSLALEVSRSAFASAQGDAYFVDLASLSAPALVPSAVAVVLDVRLGGEEPVADSVAGAIGERQLLLVLDNCEHLIDAVARLVETIIHTCPRVSVLATSRENLHLYGEYVYRVPPLGVPPEQDEDPDVILAQSAVQLFIARISALLAAFSPDPADLLEVAAICRHLDGIPLAIEFAAARAATLGIRQVARRLDKRFGLLNAGRQMVLPRHQTLYAALDWSYELLPEEERRLLRRSAVFPAGFTLAAAAAVTNDAGRVSSSVVEGIANLITKSLVTFDGPASAGRWRLLETIRAYALEKLAEKGETEEVARLSAEFLRDLFGPTGRTSQEGSSAEEKARSRREIDNIRAGLDWAFSPTGDPSIGLELTANSASLWFELTLMTEYRDRVRRALKRFEAMSEPNDVLEMRLQAALGHSLWYCGPDIEPLAMGQAFERALALAERVGDIDTLLQAVWGTWAGARGRADYRAALAAASRYQTIAGEVGDKRSAIFAERILALSHHDLGDQTLARRHVENVLSQARLRDPHANMDFQADARVAMLTMLARIQWLQGFPDQAMATAQEAFDTGVQIGHWWSICYVLFVAGCPLSFWVGNLEEAQRRVDMLRDWGGNLEWKREARVYAAILRLRQGSEGDALTAAYIEPRVQWSTAAALVDFLTRAAKGSVPLPDDVPFDTPWSLPEVLRVEAELLLWRGGPDADSAAEAKLRSSLELAREQSTRSWELRAAVSFARLRIAQNRPGDARQLLEPVYNKFTEGFRTLDLRSAKAILESLPEEPPRSRLNAREVTHRER